MENLSIQQLEYAINFWRQQIPSSSGSMTLCKPASHLAEVYALMIINGRGTVAFNTLSEQAQQAVNAALEESNQIRRAA